MPSLLLVDYLQRCRAHYALINAEPAFTAEETARRNRIPPRRFAKVVVAHTDAELLMVVMPAHHRLAPELLRRELDVEKVELAAERQFKNRFPRCELGALPPFGHLFGLRAVFLASAFDAFSDIFCKAGSHGELLRMPFSEFTRFAHLEPIKHGAVLQLRSPTKAHLQRLLRLAKEGAPQLQPRRSLIVPT